MPIPTAAGPGPPGRRVTVADGVGLHCVEWAPGAGRRRPFVLVHGLASNGRTWEAVAARLAAAGHPVATVDQRGHGRSDKPDGGYDFATLCHDLLAVLDALGYERPVMVGQSMGGNVALELARTAGDRLGGVGGVDGGLIELRRQWPAWDDCVAALAPPRWDGVRAEEVEARLRRSFPTWSDWGIEATMANFDVPADGSLRPHLTLDRHLRLLRALWEHRPSAVVSEIGLPVVLVLADRGEGDAPDRRADAEQAAAGLERARLHWLSPADHDVHVQDPDTVARLLHGAAVDGFFRP